MSWPLALAAPTALVVPFCARFVWPGRIGTGIEVSGWLLHELLQCGGDARSASPCGRYDDGMRRSCRVDDGAHCE